MQNCASGKTQNSSRHKQQLINEKGFVKEKINCQNNTQHVLMFCLKFNDNKQNRTVTHGSFSSTIPFFVHHTLYERLNMAGGDEGVTHLVNMSIVFTFSRIHILSGQRI